MTALPQPRPLSAVSDRIARPLRDVASRQWKLTAGRALLQTLCVGLAITLGAALLLGLFPSIPTWLCFTLAATTWAAVLAATVFYFRPALRRRSLSDAALLVERQVPGLNERLTSAVELSADPSASLGSPLLIRHLVRQAESDAAAVRADAVLPSAALKRPALLLAPVLILWLAAAALAPRPLIAGLYRVLMPWRDHLPSALTIVSVTPGDVTLAEGDSLEISASVKSAAGPEQHSGRALLLTRAAAADRTVSQDFQPAAAPNAFKTSLADVRQTFSYRVSTDHGDSPWFTATVLPRPAVARLDLRYDYPTYTGLDSARHPNSDGAIKALQGTDVTLTVHCADPLDLADGKSRLVIAEGTRQRDAEFKPVQETPNAYEARLTVFNSGSYRIHLVNRHGLTNKDDHPRAIVAQLDLPPKVAVTAPESEITVRADDDVPIAFAASDDFGVAKLQAMVQVEDKPAESVDVVLRSTDRRQIESAWQLSVPAHLARAGLPEAKRITYWLRATDNRDPDPQATESAKQTIKIDSAQPLAYRTRVEQQHAKDLIQAIDRAIQRLSQSEGQVNSLKDIDRGRAMNADEKNRAKEQREQLAKTSGDLADAAESNLRNAFSAVAAKAKEVAESPIQGAAENVARSLLNADDAAPRRKAAAEAATQVTDARKQLEELKRKVEARTKELQAARELEKLAQKQAELARDQQPPGGKGETAEQKRQQERLREKSQQRQRELAERLQRAIGESEALRDPKAAEQAIRLRELLDRIEQLQKDHAPLKQQLAKQEEVSRLREEAEALAARQEELNQAIRRFAEQQRPPLKRADATAPDPRHQEGIIDRLRHNEPQQAHDMQRHSVELLKQATKQLQERGRSRELRPNPVEQVAVQQREQAKQSAQQLAEEAKRAAEQFRAAKEAKNAEQLAQARKSIDESAQKLTEQARAAADAVRDAAASGDPTAEKDAADAKKASEAAQAAVEAARREAQQGDPGQTAKKLEEAGQQLAKAQQEALEATQADLLADQQAASKKAADEAKGLAERQAELAEATKQTAKALEQARRDLQPPQDVANRQNQLKDQTQKALQHADQLEQLAKATHPSLAERAAAAEALLKEAAAAEARAAESGTAVAKAQQQSSQAIQQAAEANQKSAQLEQEAADAAGQAAEHQQQAEAATRQAADAQARKDEAAAKAAARQVEQAKQQTDKRQKQSESTKQQSAAAEKRADDAVKRAEAAQAAADAAREKSTTHQGQAEQALAKAEEALRDVDRLAAEASARPRAENDTAASSPPDAQPAAEARADAQEGPSQGANGAESNEAPPPPLTPEQAMRQAAQGAQEAAQAQQQAMNGNADPGAIRQAAAALQQAASAMSAATASSESSDSALAGADQQAEEGADAQSAQETASAAASSSALDSRIGAGTGGGTHDGRPQSVQELGISAGDWARLGPLNRQELLNAARQSGPPAYREMIKNYYVKIARLGADGRAAK